ncbi:MAG: LacI family DNA-binding transcriptional regulator [Paracoccaceae bacterium]
MATIKDIAQRSGAGISTVSRVLNNSGYVSSATRSRVEKAIADLGYRPNASARMMRNGRSNLIGILVPSIKVDFFARLAHRLEQALFAQGYQTLICSTAEDVGHENEYVSMLLAQQVDGAVVVSVGGDGGAFSRLKDAGIPLIALDRQLDGLGVKSVRADHFAGGQLATEHLIELGHSKISIIGAPEQSEPVRLRAAGAADACKRAALEAPQIVLGTDHSVQGCAALAQKALETTDRPSAIVATSDIAAIGTLHAARILGIAIPHELSVTGFDDTPMAAYVFPAITTVAQPIDQIAHECIAALLNMIRAPAETDQNDVILPVVLNVRQSTATVP